MANVCGDRTYIGMRYVPLITGQWDEAKAYEPLSVVLYENDSYTSKTFVPAGTLPTDERYWSLTGNYNAQIAEVSGEQFKYCKCYETVADMTADGKLKAGMTCHTNGFYESGDGGAAWYRVVESPTGDEPNGMDVLQGSGVVCELIYGVYANQYGATETVEDCSPIFNHILQKQELNLLPMTYKTKNAIIAKNNINGNDANIYCSGTTDMMWLNEVTEITVRDVKLIGDSVWDGVNISPGNVKCGIRLIKSNSNTFDNVTIQDCGTHGVYLQEKTWNCYFYNCHMFRNHMDGINAINLENNPSESNATTLYFYGCKFRHNAGNGITINGYQLTFVGGVVEGNLNGVVFLQTNNTCGIVGFYGVDIEGNTNSAVVFQESTYGDMYFEKVTFDTCQIYGSTTNTNLFIIGINTNLIFYGLNIVNCVLNTPSGNYLTGSNNNRVCGIGNYFNEYPSTGIIYLPQSTGYNAERGIKLSNILTKIHNDGLASPEIEVGEQAILKLDCIRLDSLSFTSTPGIAFHALAANEQNDGTLSQYSYDFTENSGTYTLNLSGIFTDTVFIYHDDAASHYITNVRYKGILRG